MATSPRALALALALAFPAWAPAAGPPWRIHPEYSARMAAVRTVAVVAPQVSAHELTANGTVVARPDRDELVRENVAAGLEAELRSRNLGVKRLARAAVDSNAELHEVELLYHAVASAIVQATYANEFPWKTQRFEYSLGDLGPLLSAEGVDAVVFALGSATNSSGGRIAAELLLGSSTHAADQLFVALVDRSGEVVWFAEHHETASDLRAPASARAFVAALVSPLPPSSPGR